MGAFCNCKSCGKPVSVDTSYSILGNDDSFYSYHCPYCNTYDMAQSSQIFTSDTLTDTRDPNVIRIEKLEEEIIELKDKLKGVEKTLDEYRSLFNLIASQDLSLEYDGHELMQYYEYIENKEQKTDENQKN